MKQTGRGMRFLSLLTIVMVIILPTLAMAQDSEEVSVLGMVTAEGLLVTEDGEEYLIDQEETEEGKDLLQMQGKKVVVNGVVSETDGTFVIVVNSFSEAE